MHSHNSPLDPQKKRKVMIFYHQDCVIDYAIQAFSLEKYIWLMCDYGLCDNCFQICRLRTLC